MVGAQVKVTMGRYLVFSLTTWWVVVVDYQGAPHRPLAVGAFLVHLSFPA